MFKSKNEIDDVLLIGGAGYSYPKYYISHYPDRKMDVVEIDGKITEIAKKYFYLDDLIKDYNINENHRLNLITEDGRTYLNRCEKKYDAILNDAFSGENPAKTLTTLENIKNIKKSLNENGLYLTNIISSLDGSNSKFIKAEVNTLKQVFKNVYAIPCQNLDNSIDVQNIMVIATDDSIKYDNTYDLKIDKNEIIITDDFCPIDKLVPQVK
jgi:spermidine synthase